MEPNRIIRRAELLTIIGVSRSTLYQWMADGIFPRPIKLGRRAVGWPSSALNLWLNSRAEINL